MRNTKWQRIVFYQSANIASSRLVTLLKVKAQFEGLPDTLRRKTRIKLFWGELVVLFTTALGPRGLLFHFEFWLIYLLRENSCLSCESELEEPLLTGLELVLKLVVQLRLDQVFEWLVQITYFLTVMDVCRIEHPDWQGCI